jgi:aminoglycoside phosphotransferase (APT) family kinase protein
MDTPAADIDVDHALVGRLVSEQHPDLQGDLTLVANGWDNALYRLGDRLCVRIPRRQVAAALIAGEQRWLPVFAKRVRLPIPVPVRVGVPSETFPWPWSICPWFAGRTAGDVEASHLAGIAGDLAEFLTQLHVPAPVIGPDAQSVPHNPVRGVALHTRSPAVHERLARGTVPHADAVHALWHRLTPTEPWGGPSVWIHGDLHPANILLSETAAPADPTRAEPDASARVAAVLDFGDLTAGDPATDLAVGWLALDANARADFRSRLPQYADDDATWQRARGWALNMATAMAAHSDDNPRMAAIGRHALEQVLGDE